MFAGNDAATAFHKAAQCFMKAKSDGEASGAYIECSRCYIKAGDPKAGAEILENEVLPRVVDAGKLSQAAKLHGELAAVRAVKFFVGVCRYGPPRSSHVALQTLEGESQWEEAIKHYQNSADYYSAENAPTTAIKALVKIAELNVYVSHTRMAAGLGSWSPFTFMEEHGITHLSCSSIRRIFRQPRRRM
jgi:hypothetical protein